MNYETAKALKDAGFPFDKDKIAANGWTDGDEPVYFPTLEELIEAIGDDFVAIVRGRDWVAQAVIPLKPFSERKNEIIAHGDTPTEALAKLYIALHTDPNAKTVQSTS